MDPPQARTRAGGRGALPPGGRLVTLEADPKHAEVARANLASAGLAGADNAYAGLAGIINLPKPLGTMVDQVGSHFRVGTCSM